MQDKVFYPIKSRRGWFWKTFSFLLLMGGASSVIDIEKLIVSADKVIIKVFMSEDIIIPFREISFMRSKSGAYTAIKGAGEWIKLSKFQDPDVIVSAIKEAAAHSNQI